MKHLDQLQQFIIGQQLAGLFHTKQKQIEGGFSGLNLMYSFQVVFQLADLKKYRLDYSDIYEWDGDDELLIVDKNSWEIKPGIEYIGQIITAIETDETDQIALLLSNNVCIKYRMDWGSGLSIERSE